MLKLGGMRIRRPWHSLLSSAFCSFLSGMYCPNALQIVIISSSVNTTTAPLVMSSLVVSLLIEYTPIDNVNEAPYAPR